MGIFISDNPIREITDIHVGIDNIARRCKKGWVGVDGIARLVFVDNTVDPTEIRRFGTYYETNNGSYSRTESHTCSNSELVQDYRADWIPVNTNVDPSRLNAPTANYGQLYSLYIESSSSVFPKDERYPYYNESPNIMYAGPEIVTINGIEYRKYRNLCFLGYVSYFDPDTGDFSSAICEYNRVCRFNSDYIPNDKNMSDPDYVKNPWKVVSLTETNMSYGVNWAWVINMTLQRTVKYDFEWQGTPPPASLWELSGVELVDNTDPTQGAYQIWRKR